MTERLRRIVGWWQIACGSLGLAFFASALAGVLPGGREWAERVLGPINLLFGAAFFALVVLAGRGLLRHVPRAVPVSLACQAVQVLSFAALGGPHVAVAAGPALGFTLASTRVNVAAGFNATFFLGTRVSGPAWEVTVNLLALAWTIALARALRAQRSVPPAATADAPAV